MGGGVGGGGSGRATLLRGYTLFLSISFFDVYYLLVICMCPLDAARDVLGMEAWRPE